MVGIGMLMIGCAVVGLLLRRGGRYWQQPVFLNVLRLMAFTPFVAVLCGWVVTEVGRFPWVVYGQMSHSEGLTPSLTRSEERRVGKGGRSRGVACHGKHSV